MATKFINLIHMKPGALSRQLGVPIKKNIPMKLLKKIVVAKAGQTINNPCKTGKRRIKVTHLVERRSILAINLKNMKRR
jgi:hypothetical protein